MWLFCVCGHSSALCVSSCECVALLDTLQSYLAPPPPGGVFGGGEGKNR